MGVLLGPPSTNGAVATEDSLVLRVSRLNFMAIQHADPGLSQKLLMTLLVQNETHRPGRIRALPKAREVNALDSSLSQSRLKFGSLAYRLLNGVGFQVDLTDSQVTRFGKVFEIICDDPDKNEIKTERFSRYVGMEARAMGSVLEKEQFMEMVDKSGIDEDGDGVLTLDEFLKFLRGLFLSDLPPAEIPVLQEAYNSAMALNPNSPMDESRIHALFGAIGFDSESSQMKTILGVIDADGDGDVSFGEFLTGVGMMKLHCIQSGELNRAFLRYKQMSAKSRKKVSSVSDDMCSLGRELDSMDLVAFLNISQKEAEEMVFLADQDELENWIPKKDCDDIGSGRTIDRLEFQELIMKWS